MGAICIASGKLARKSINVELARELECESVKKFEKNLCWKDLTEDISRTIIPQAEKSNI